MEATQSAVEDSDMDEQVFLLFLQEPWIDKDGRLPRAANLQIFTPSNSPKCAIYVRAKSHKPKILYTIEDHTISLQVRIGGVDAQVIGTYSPGRPDTLARILPQLKITKHCLVMGDFNCHHERWYGKQAAAYHYNIKNNRVSAEKIVDFIDRKQLQLLNQVGTFTHFPRNNTRPTCIDLALAKGIWEDRFSVWGINPAGYGSDHGAITVMFNLQPPRFVPKRQWHKTDWGQFHKLIAELQDLTWDTAENTRLSASYVIQYLNNCIDATTPWSKPFERSKPWWTKDLAEQRKHLKHRERKARKEPSQENAEALRKANRAWTASVRKARRSWEEKRYAAMTKQELWKSLYKERSITGIPALQGDKTFEGKCRLLGERFFPEKRMSPNPLDLSKLRKPLINLSEQFDEVTQDEIIRALQSCAAGSTPGIDMIRYPTLIAAVNANRQLFQDMFTALLFHGVHPDEWKPAICVPVPKPKKDDYSHPKAYRPICLLSCFDKLLGKIVAKRLATSGELVGALTGNQFGAREGLSSMDALIRTITPAQRWLNVPKTHGKHQLLRPALLTNDVRGAFDSVVHQHATAILQQQQFPNYLVHWVTDYLRDRTYHMRFEGRTGPEAKVWIGTPQGSPISPVLYMIYAGMIIDPPDPRAPTEMDTSYVDDDALLQAAKQPSYLVNRLNMRMKNRIERAIPLEIEYEPEKSDLLHMKPTTSNKADLQDSVRVNGIEIKPKTKVKYVGVWLDTRLNFREHVEQAVAKGYKALWRVRRIRNRLNQSVTRFAIMQCVLPAVFFGSKAWWTGAKHLLQSLNSFYNMCARIITFLPVHTNPGKLLLEAGMPPLHLYLDSLTRRYGTRVLTSPSTHPLSEALLNATPASKEETGLQRIKALLLPFQTRGNLADRWRQKQAIQQNLLDEWRREAPANHPVPPNTDLPKPMVKLGQIKAYKIRKIRCQVTKLDRFNRDHPIECVCGMEQSAKHLFMECQKWNEERRDLIDHIKGPATWENWMFSDTTDYTRILKFAEKVGFF